MSMKKLEGKVVAIWRKDCAVEYVHVLSVDMPMLEIRHYYSPYRCEWLNVSDIWRIEECVGRASLEDKT